MKTKYNVGEHISVSGTISRIEILPNEMIVYYMDEAPGVPIKEKDICKETKCGVVLNGMDEFTKKLEEFGETLEKARSLYADLAHFDMKLNLGYDSKGEFVTTELAHIFTDMSSD